MTETLCEDLAPLSLHSDEVILFEDVDIFRPSLKRLMVHFFHPFFALSLFDELCVEERVEDVSMLKM